ncbi:hypothetical protein OF829_19135 [Sphingomonas sp. LB-2]|uniref:hypothetical protein n=1 Tax=Sphingomonas caeni TaxID=2984949 RepID=UPI0022329EB0|nr:hypothetical protein [Sphingomonas caeni]MCW3849359.1 hypothetical protein [Sphingomonas caeni]
MSEKITVVLDEAEFRALAGLLDAAVRAGGLRAAKDALSITAKMEAAYNEAHPEAAETNA